MPEFYLPSLGQLALIYMYKDEINEYLNLMEGISFEGVYWSCTEKSKTEAWAINFDTGEIVSYPKDSGNKVRAIKDLNVQSTLVNRISNLETKVTKLENLLLKL
jgi:hypothetical protein